MLIVFNWIGAGIIILSMVIGAVLASGFAIFFGKAALPLSLACSGLVVIILDLLYRHKAGEWNLFHPRGGGHVFFIPIWILGGFFILMSICELVSPGSLAPDRFSSSRRAQADGSTPVYARSAYGSSAPTPTEQEAPPGGSLESEASMAAMQPAPIEPPRTSDGLKLVMISGAPGHRIAMINGEPFSEGETHKLTLGDRRVTVQCVEIRDQSVVAKIEGEAQVRSLKVDQTVSLSPESGTK